MSKGLFRPTRIAGGLRDRLGSRRRRSHTEWGSFPERAPAGSSWWSDDPQWFPGGTPPRHASVQPFIDGQELFLAAWQAITEAKHSVWLVDWAMTPDMELVRGADRGKTAPANGPKSTGYRVFDLITAIANTVDVRILVWNGSLLFKPRSISARRGVHQLHRANPRVHARVDKHIHLTHCHHQKTIVVDGTTAFVGGLDMTTFDSDRWDMQSHPVRVGLNWHDIAFRLQGDAAQDVARNFVDRWNAITGERIVLPPPARAKSEDNQTPVQIVRTIPAKLYPFAPEGEFGIAWAFRQAFMRARKYIYLENQYLWSPAAMRELADALRRVDDPEFRIVLVLPARPNIGKDDTDEHVRYLRELDGTRGRVHVFSLYTSAPETARGWIYKPIYVHAKVAIVDDEWCMAGSANLNGRGLESDTEIDAQVSDPRVARDLRLRLWEEHLGLPCRTLDTLSPAEAVDRHWASLGRQGRTTIDGRAGALAAKVVTYELSDMPGDLSIGELEAHLLDA
jgi:phosphatidylserine/phosphatidylglycerophosphate/cardiolipin synthase-like enzyme